MVEMHLSALRVERPSNNPLLLLQEIGGRRTLPIYIGNAEAQAIAFAQQGIQTPRPMTHDLMKDILDELGARVEAVVVTELRDATYFAELRLVMGGRRYSVSARPSDAIALAVRTSAPIYADDELLAEEGIILEEDVEPGGSDADPEELVSEFRDFIEQIRPEDFEG